jgi:hypothetical protein
MSFYVKDRAFKRPGVLSRLKLDGQSSRERIAETEQGLFFIGSNAPTISRRSGTD